MAYPEGYYPHEFETPDSGEDACYYCGQEQDHEIHTIEAW